MSEAMGGITSTLYMHKPRQISSGVVGAGMYGLGQTSQPLMVSLVLVPGLFRQCPINVLVKNVSTKPHERQKPLTG